MPNPLPYSYLPFVQARQQLANRLFDSSKQFWSDLELGKYIVEALRTWNALTSYWRGDFTFQSQQGVSWYDLTDRVAMPNTLRPYTLTDVDIYTAIQYHLLEPAGSINPWTGVSSQFTPDDLVNAVQRRRDELLSLAGCTITRRTLGAVLGRIPLPDTVIDVRRMAYLPAVGSPSTMWPEDTWAEQSFATSYLQNTPGTPLTYLMSTQPPISFDTDRPPGSAGVYELLTVEAGQSLASILVGAGGTIPFSFTLPNQNPIGVPWIAAGAFPLPQILNNAVSPASMAAATTWLMLYGGISWSPNQSSQATIVQLVAGKGYLALVLRCDATAQNFYYIDLDASGIAGGVGGIGIPTPLNLQKVAGGVQSLLSQFPAVTPQIGDIFTAQVSGATISVFQNGVFRGSFTDPSPIPVGSPGLLLESSAALSTPGDLAWKDWVGSGNIGSFLFVPDDWIHIIKWGALADLLGRESNAKDVLRATYCEQRYKMGIAALKESAALLAMRIGNVPLQIDAVKDADHYQTSWQALAQGKPSNVYQSGLNLLALAAAPDAGLYSLTATVVENAPIPVADNDPVEIARDDYDAMLDYAQHLAAFKLGGAEFLSTMPLLQHFFGVAQSYNVKLSQLGEYTSILYGLSSHEEARNPRMTLESAT
jgi:hypothetical protein